MASPLLDAQRQLSAEGLRDLLTVVNSSRGLDEILSYLVRQAHRVLGSDGVGMYLRDPSDPDNLLVQASRGVPRDLQFASAPVGYPVIGLTVSSGRTVVATDMLAALGRPRAARVEDQLVDRGTYLEVVCSGPVSAQDPSRRARNERLAASYRTIAAVPLSARGETYGSLVLYYHASHAYGADQVDLSLAFAQQAALAIENAHLRTQANQRLHEIERRQRVAEALRDLLAVVNSTPDFDEILGEALAQSSRLLGNAASAVYLLGGADRSDILHMRAARGLRRQSVADQIRVGSPTTGLAVQQGRTLVCEDLRAALVDGLTRSSETQLEEKASFARIVAMSARTDPDLEIGYAQPRVRQLASRFRAVMSTPLRGRGGVFGAITLFYTEPRTFSAEEVDLARTFAEQATLAIENARLHAEADQRMQENERRRRVAEGMRDLMASINSTRPLNEIMDLVLAQASELLGSDAGSVSLLTDSQLLAVRASRGLAPELVPTRLPVGVAITGVAAERCQPVAVFDLLEALPIAGQPDPAIEERSGFLKIGRVGSARTTVTDAVDLPRLRKIAREYRAVLAVPLAIRNQVLGAITLYYRRPRAFSHEDVQLAQGFADQTALAIENARLHSQAVRRTRDLEALYRADEALYRSLRLDQVLQALVDVAADVLEADMTSVLVWDERHERLVPGATRGFRPESVAQMSHAAGDGITSRVALSGEPITVEDATSDPRVAHRITDAEGIRSLLHVPIKVSGAVFGVFGVNYRQPRTLAGEEQRVLLALAHRAAVAIENAHIFAESESRRHELEALYRADQALHRSLRLDDVLRTLVEMAIEVLGADKSSVHIWDAERLEMVIAASHGYSSESTAFALVPKADLEAIEFSGAAPIVMADAVNDPRLVSTRLREVVAREGIRASIGVPIVVSGQAFGIFGVAFCQPHLPSQDEQRLVQALAQRAGLAIDNARLFEQAQQAATAEERQRLARELHDAVTQSLFSASLIAEVVPRLWERDPGHARQRLEDLRRLTRGALAEMRTLLLELRPAALVEMPFPQLLRQLAEAAASRSNLHIDVHLGDDDVRHAPLPGEVQIGLYRIAQEALNNTAKHAGATRARIHFRRRGDRVDLRLSDDGRGYDPAATPPGHLGLGIMHERARAIGAQLRIETRPGGGTRIDVHWRRVAA